MREESGAPGEIRTPDLLLRRQPLYPAELRARTFVSELYASFFTFDLGSKWSCK